MSFLNVFDYQLVYRNGDMRGEAIHIEQGKNLLGRSSHCHIQLDTPDVSRQHCVLVRSGSRMYVYDLGSRNGTRINRKLVETKTAVELRHGDKLTIGRWKFRFLVKDALSGKSVHSAPVESNTNVAPTPTRVLNELDAIAEALEISADEFTDTQSAIRVPPRQTLDAASQPKTSAPSKSKLPPIDPRAKRSPIGLPDHARPQGPSDPRAAADETLRKMFRP
ncbi:FHA domain-containing protein [Aporhodopirellula aestuarii]|uniref:FHA domain-containing protein n=1 Tax=Aporhodopirellula aestuarii TaxID=2950107 RepID=A0ABT0TYS4_9BACT|nr:FHA domain-containing protein [Aporhodopirellula aestuarii]MCM2369747.1 FHA domain-containing protein [Aporhodopirellula aestuarii]